MMNKISRVFSLYHVHPVHPVKNGSAAQTRHRYIPLEPDDSKVATSVEPLATFSLSGEQGLNQFRWDLVLKSQTSSQPYFINFREHIKPGKYRIRIETQQGAVSEKRLSVVDATDED